MRKRDYQAALRRCAAGATIAAAACLVVPAVASAGEVSTAANTLTFNAAPGEANGLTVTNPSGTEIRFNDTVLVQMTETSDDCIPTGLTQVSCDIGTLNGAIFLDLGDQNDTASTSGVAMDTIVEPAPGPTRPPEAPIATSSGATPAATSTRSRATVGVTSSTAASGRT